MYRTWGFGYSWSWLILVLLTFATLGTAFLSTNLTDDVQWDNYSLLVKGQRIFLHSGEFHTYRLPVPSLWLDILQKMKAMGLNGVSVYLHWGEINPAPGVIDLDGIRSLQTLFDAAKVAGIWIVLRPGPYINAETTAGGLPHWVTSQVAGIVRTNDTDYTASWQEYISAIVNATVPNQITHGGPVIGTVDDYGNVDNEYSQTGYGHAEYFQELEQALRAGGIVVPFTYNDPGELRSFINGTVCDVSIYEQVDAYPQRYNCSFPDVWPQIADNWHDYHEDVNPSEPFYFPEFQGGSFDAYGPTSPGYLGCQRLTGPEYEDVVYKMLWAANVKMLNFYMLYGGTSWGGIPYPGVYTSYDYGAAIAENRLLTPKAIELKRQGLFLRSSPDFYKTNWVGNSSSSAVNISNPNAFAVFLRNPDTGTGFYIARQNDTTSTATTDFGLQVSTTNGTLEIPQTIPSITLTGRQSKVIVTDYRFGGSHVLYSTASILFAGQIGNRDVLFLYGDSDQQHEFAIDLKGSGSVARDPAVKTTKRSETTIFSITGNVTRLITLFDSGKQLILFSDTNTAGTFSAPVIPNEHASGDARTFANYWQLGSNSTILVGGPYLVRNASISGSELRLQGDLNATDSTTLTVIAPPEVSSVFWNGRNVHTTKDSASSATSRGGFIAQLQPYVSISVPELSGWRFADSLPEVQSNFSDADWTIANHTSTNIPFKPYYGDGRVLYGCDYGFCEGAVLWRGHFNASGDEKSVNLSVNGGQAFAASVWLNDIYLDTAFGNSTNDRNILEETDQVFTFPESAVLAGRDNVITIVQDNMGNNETGYGTDGPKSPRGVRGFQLDTGTFGEWRVQGKIGGYTSFLDRTRGVMNDGGLFGERQGWHLPGFNTTGSEWVDRDLSEGLPSDAAGIGFFVTTFDLHIPSGTDVPMSFVFDDGAGYTGAPYRALLFVNGWMMGKRIANLGPQAAFPVHEGILNYSGMNTVAIALWSMLPQKGVSPTLCLSVDAILEGGVGGIVVNNPSYESVRGNWL
ncbi:glycoside hydrolase family 35 protein [Fomitiporia mediterranea MF3/22]|uniref:glycoside hydrolase family 35 protein n=1 Tax=Fomitiporia mediterranea (strain MF3/22) TaxID=694068 RepID=UPI000440993A|nr:glycoside hydrolase family 35 protein [Fomitiporia mediterranea MF3/22]EJC98868.1 glycoside hydrolase family 35 protein [Fomitiporia mediterranea MF3/22]